MKKKDFTLDGLSSSVHPQSFHMPNISSSDLQVLSGIVSCGMEI